MASNNFINECKEYANSNRLGKITIGNNEINQDNYLSEFEVNDGCFVNGSIIGSVYVKAFNGNFLELPDTIEIENKQLNVQAGVKFDDDTTEYVNLGNYDITTIKNSQTDIPTSIEAFDRLMNKLDKKYVCNIDFSTSKTIKDVYVDVCNNLGLTPVTTTFLNSDIEVVGNPFTENDTNRAVLQAICKVSCSYVELDESTGKIDLKWLSTSAEPDYIFNDGDDFSTLEGGITTFGPVNVVTIANSEVPSENVSMGTGDNEVVINEDYFLYNATLRQKAITNIYNRLKGLTYVDLKLTTYTGKPFIKVGSKIRVIYEGKTYDTYALIHTFKYDGTFTSIIESPALTKQETQIKNDVSLKEVIKNTQLIVNKQEGKINGLVTKTEDLEKEVTTIKETNGNNSLYIEDALESRVLEYGIDGKSEQDGTPTPDTPVEIKNVDGIRNLWKPYRSTTTLNGITLTSYEDGSFDLRGTATANANFIWFVPISEVDLIDGEYYCLHSNQALPSTNVRIEAYNEATWLSSLLTISGNTYNKSLEIERPSNVTQYRYIIQVVSGGTVDLKNVKIQLEKGPIAHPNVPYGSWLRVQTTGKNILNPQDCEIGNINTTDGTDSISNIVIRSKYIKLKKGTYSLKVNDNESTFKIFRYALYDINRNFISSSDPLSKNISITIDDECYIRVCFYRTTWATLTIDDLIDSLVQFEQGASTDYEPYKENISLIDMNKPNEFNVIEYINDETNNGYVSYDETKGITILKADGRAYDNMTYRVPVKPSTQYSVLLDNWTNVSNIQLMYYSSGGSYLGALSLTENKIITIGVYCYYIKLKVIPKSYPTNVGNLIIIEGFNNYYELCSINAKDNLKVSENGTTTIEKKIVEIVLDGSETIKNVTGNNGAILHCISVPNCSRTSGTAIPNILSNKFIKQTRDGLYNGFVDGICYGSVGSTYYYDIIIRSSELDSMSVDEFKTWLSENKPTIQYELAEPYTIDLGQVDISLFENINHINLVDDIETDTRVKYLINNVMNGTYATKGELELTNEQFQTTITNEFNSLERQMTSITQTGGAIDLAIQSSKNYTDSKNESLDNRITNSENNYNDLNNKYNTLNGKITDMNFSFKTDGLTIGTSGSEINSKLDNKGLKIYNASTLIAIFNQNGSGFKKLIATESIQLQNLLIQKRVINTPKANNMEVISFFFNKSLIENLTDLESD